MFPKSVFAVCPVCTVAVTAGLGLSRWLGIDDTVSGIWIGGLIISSSVWFSTWLLRKHVQIPFLFLWSSLVMYVIVLLPLFWFRIIGHSQHALWGIDKIILGVFVGSCLFLMGMGFDRITRLTNGGHIRFSYQKIIFPVTLLCVGSGIFYAITR